jgi:DNA-binding CsgD family transcriptional regulator/PAS domain-containing protein
VSSRADVSELVAVIYDAALDPACWPLFLDRLAGAIGAPATSLHLQSTGTVQSGQILAATGIDPALQREYDEYYASVNIWTIRGRDQLREGAVLTGQMVCPDGEVEHSEYYNDYLRRLGYFHAIAAIPIANADTHLFMTGLRPRGRGAFSERSRRLFHILTPHLRRAVSIHRRLSEAEVERAAMALALDHVPCGIVLLDGRGRVLFANTAAEASAAAADGIAFTREGLLASDGHGGRVLAALIASAAAPDAASGAGGLVKLSRPSGKPHYEVLVAPLGVSGRELFQQPRALVAVFIVDPAERPATSAALLKQLYALTPAEARVAALLVNGEPVDQIADRLRLTNDTARWVIKQILHKTDTHSQAQAVGRLLRGIGALRINEAGTNVPSGR